MSAVAAKQLSAPKLVTKSLSEAVDGRRSAGGNMFGTADCWPVGPAGGLGSVTPFNEPCLPAFGDVSALVGGSTFASRLSPPGTARPVISGDLSSVCAGRRLGLRCLVVVRLLAPRSLATCHLSARISRARPWLSERQRRGALLAPLSQPVCHPPGRVLKVESWRHGYRHPARGSAAACRSLEWVAKLGCRSKAYPFGYRSSHQVNQWL